MITSLSTGDVIDLRSDGSPLVPTLGFPSYPATFLVLSEPRELFDEYWNQHVWVADLLNLDDGARETFTVFRHKWSRVIPPHEEL